MQRFKTYKIKKKIILILYEWSLKNDIILFILL